mgnify:FL=1
MPIHLMNPNPFASSTSSTFVSPSSGSGNGNGAFGHQLPSWFHTASSSPVYAFQGAVADQVDGSDTAAFFPSAAPLYQPHHQQYHDSAHLSYQQSPFCHQQQQQPPQPEPRRASKRSRAAAELDDVLSIKRQCTQTPPQPQPTFTEQHAPLSPPQLRATSPAPFSSPSTPTGVVASPLHGDGAAFLHYPTTDESARHQYHYLHQEQQQQEQYAATTGGSRSLVGPLPCSSLVNIEDRLPSPPSALPFASHMRTFLSPQSSSSSSSSSSTAIAVRSPGSRLLFPIPPSATAAASSSAIVPYRGASEIPLWRPMRTPYVTHVEEVESSDDDDDATASTATEAYSVDAMDAMDYD